MPLPKPKPITATSTPEELDTVVAYIREHHQVPQAEDIPQVDVTSMSQAEFLNWLIEHPTAFRVERALYYPDTRKFDMIVYRRVKVESFEINFIACRE